MFLEDLSSLRTGDTSGISPDLAQKAVRLLGEFHGAWLNNPAVDDLPAIWDFRRSLIPVSGGFPELWKEIREQAHRQTSDAVIRYGDAVAERLTADPMSLVPQDYTLRHGEAHPDNFFLRGDPDDPEIVFIDWQMISI